MDPATITEITLDRGACFGTCPVFRFTASRHAGYSYEGHGHVEPLGKRSGRLYGAWLDRLAAVCIELRVLELDDHYPSDLEDAPGTVVSIRYKGGVKLIRHDGGWSMPPRLWAFAELIEVVMRDAFAVEDQRRKRGGG